MIIGIDGNEANVVNRVGIGQYAYQVLMHLNKYQISKIKYQKEKVKFKIYLKTDPLDDLPDESEEWKYEVFGPKKLWTQFALPLRLLFGLSKPDVFFTPSHYAPRFTNIPQYISIMDMSFMHYPELFTVKDRTQLTQWTAYSAKKAHKIFTISEFSKKEIVKYYDIAQEKVVVTYPGYDKTKYLISNIKYQIGEKKLLQKKYNIHKDYLLFVGTLQPRKNIVGLINAYKLIMQKAKYGPLNLVIIGKKGWLYEEIFSTVSNLQIEDKVHFLDFVPENDLAAFYRNAACFVLPSFYEGFGIPVIEAMACGCPTIVSNVSSLPEIGGDATICVDPYEIESMASGIESVLGKKDLRRSLIEKGLLRVKRFSWKSCAQKTLDNLI